MQWEVRYAKGMLPERMHFIKRPRVAVAFVLSQHYHPNRANYSQHAGRDAEQAFIPRLLAPPEQFGKQISGNKNEVVFPSKAVLFSLGYCVGAGFFILFYQGGDLVGLARYILATPFFVVLLRHTWSLPRQQKQWLLFAVLAVGLAIVWGLGGLWQFNSFYPRQAAGYFIVWLLYVVTYLAVSSEAVPWYRELAAGLYITNLLLLVYLHVLFVQGTWIN